MTCASDHYMEKGLVQEQAPTLPCALERQDAEGKSGDYSYSSSQEAMEVGEKPIGRKVDLRQATLQHIGVEYHSPNINPGRQEMGYANATVPQQRDRSLAQSHYPTVFHHSTDFPLQSDHRPTSGQQYRAYSEQRLLQAVGGRIRDQPASRSVERFPRPHQQDHSPSRLTDYAARAPHESTATRSLQGNHELNDRVCWSPVRADPETVEEVDRGRGKTAEETPRRLVAACILVWLTVLAIMYVVEMVMNVVLLGVLFPAGYYGEFSISLILIILPGYVISALSLGLYKRDDTYYTKHKDLVYKPRLNWIAVLCHLILLGPIQRYYKVASVASIYNSQFYEHIKRDTDLVRYLLTMCHTMLQVTLCIHLLLSHDTGHTHVTAVSVTGLIVSSGSALLVLWLFASNDLLSTRDVHQSKIAKVLVFLWYSLTCFARAIAFGAFSSVLGFYVLVMIGIHYVFMWIWVFSQRPIPTDPHPEEETTAPEPQDRSICETCFRNFVVKAFWVYYYGLTGIVQLFAFYNLKSGKTRYRITFYYVLMFIENMTALLLYHFFYLTWPSPLIVTLSISLFLLGMLCMILYYLLLHPRRKGRCRSMGISFCNGCHGDESPEKEERVTTYPGGHMMSSESFEPNFQNGTEAEHQSRFEHVTDIHPDFNYYLAKMSLESIDRQRTTAPVPTREEERDSPGPQRPDHTSNNSQQETLEDLV